VNGCWFRSKKTVDMMCFNVRPGNEMRVLFEHLYHPPVLPLWRRSELYSSTGGNMTTSLLRRGTTIMNEEEKKGDDGLESNEGWHERDWCWAFR
jgi:hypothetical protein